MYKGWRGGLYFFSVQSLHIDAYSRVIFIHSVLPAPLVFLFDALSTAALRGENDIKRVD